MTKKIENRLYDYAPLGFNLSHEDALEQAKGGCYISREQWAGFHFIDIAPDGTETYVIVTKDGDVILNPEETYCRTKNDWGVVYIVDKSVEIIAGKFKVLK